MRKLMIVCMLLMLCFCFVRCEYNSQDDAINTDDTAERTLLGVTYDVAYYNERKDGLRSRAYYSCLFNESDNLFLMQIHLTAGNGKTTNYYGTWEGSLDTEVVVKYERKNGELSETTYTFKDNYMYEDEHVFDKKDVKTVINKIK